MSGHWPEADRRRGQRRHGDRRADATNTRRTFIALFLVVAVAIVYNELYPFQWYDRPGDQVGAVAFLLSTIGDVDKAGDLPAILMFVPFGFLAIFAMPLDVPGQTRVAGALVAAVLLGVWIELARYQDVEQTATMGHVYASAIGAGVGAGVALLGQRRRWSLVRSLGVERVELILLIMWAGDRLFPYIPVPNPHSAQDIVAPLLVPVLSDPLGTVRAAVRWLMVAYLAETLGGWRWAQLFALFVFGEFAGRVLIGGHDLSQPDMLGAVVAFVAWLVLRHLVFGRLLLVVAFAALIVVVRLAPFDFVGLPHGFGWLPFQSLMHGSTADLVRGIFSDAFLYGGLIWLLTRLRLSFAVATALTVMLVLVITGMQSWTTGPAGEITDVVVAALVGSALFLLGGDETAEG